MHEYVRQEDWYDKWCSVKKKCIGTMDRSKLNEADAVVFHLFPSDWEVEDLPSQRSPSQYYVALINEPPSYSGVSKMLSQLPANFFNLSMTFRQDSQLPYTYLTTTKLSPYRQRDPLTILQRVKQHPKKKMIAWFVSNCKTHSDRESYVKELKKYIDVDIYGACGPLKCSSKKIKDKSCYRMLEKDYKFYLSFENSICKDYVSEKLGNYLQYDIIPVTLGGANYSQVAPPHSFINALDYKSPKELAKYLKWLVKHEREYYAFYEWKSKYQVHRFRYGLFQAFCHLCEVLNENETDRNQLDVRSWWLQHGVCKTDKFHF